MSAAAKSQPTAQDETVREAPPRPVFIPFEWVRIGGDDLVPAHLAAEIAGYARDIACGVEVLLQLVEREDIDEDCADEKGEAIPPLMSPVHLSYLQRLAIASLHLLGEKAASTQDTISDFLARSKAGK